MNEAGESAVVEEKWGEDSYRRDAPRFQSLFISRPLLKAVLHCLFNYDNFANNSQAFHWLRVDNALWLRHANHYTDG